MTLAIIEHQPKQSPITIPPRQSGIWFPNLDAAHREVLDYYETLPSASNPKRERFSQRDCRLRCMLFMDFLKDNDIKVPDKRAMDAYVAHMRQKGLSGKTIHVYLVYARHICKRLGDQFIHPDIDDKAYRYAAEVRHAVTVAATYPNPKIVVQKNSKSVYAKGKRLTLDEAQTILDHIDTSDLKGKRDAALMLTGFVTGFRLSELGRITLDSISETKPGIFSVTVRAKGGKLEPRAIDRGAVTAIRAYVDAFNAQLETGDPRRIRADQPVWMPLTRSGNIFKDKRRPMTPRGLSNVITSRSGAPGPEYAIKAHDLRRTWAANAEQLGMDAKDIQEQMLHESAKQTADYIARPKDISSQNIVACGFNLTLK